MPRTASKDEALDLFATKFPSFLDQARSIAQSISVSRGSVTADDLWERCPPPANANVKIMGAVFKGPGWKVIGFEPSQRKEARARIIRRWVWVG
jgi:hypothetical protein